MMVSDTDRKIKAIKKLRDMFPVLGLKDAKNAVEAIIPLIRRNADDIRSAIMNVNRSIGEILGIEPENFTSDHLSRIAALQRDRDELLRELDTQTGKTPVQDSELCYRLKVIRSKVFEGAHTEECLNYKNYWSPCTCWKTPALKLLDAEIYPLWYTDTKPITYSQS
jgi:hypothetical protein